MRMLNNISNEEFFRNKGKGDPMNPMRYLKHMIDQCMTALTETSGNPCYSNIQDQTTPYRYVEVTTALNEQTKTFDYAIVTIQIHTIFPHPTSTYEDNIYEWLEQSEQAMSDIIFTDVTCTNTKHLGLISMETKVTKERHAIQAYEYTICE